MHYQQKRNKSNKLSILEILKPMQTGLYMAKQFIHQDKQFCAIFVNMNHLNCYSFSFLLFNDTWSL